MGLKFRLQCLLFTHDMPSVPFDMIMSGGTLNFTKVVSIKDAGLTKGFSFLHLSKDGFCVHQSRIYKNSPQDFSKAYEAFMSYYRRHEWV